jgi:hypothetical protein
MCSAVVVQGMTEEEAAACCAAGCCVLWHQLVCNLKWKHYILQLDVKHPCLQDSEMPSKARVLVTATL